MNRISVLLALIILTACRVSPIDETASSKIERAQLASLAKEHFEVPPTTTSELIPRIYEVIAVEGEDAYLACGAMVRYKGVLYILTVAHTVMVRPTKEQALASRLSNFVPLNQTVARPKLVTRDYKGNVFNLTLTRHKRQFDIALLKVESSERVLPETITPHWGHTEQGADVLVCGHRVEIGRRVALARIDKQVAGMVNDHECLTLNLYRTSQLVVPGYSGGPVYASDGATLVGITVARTRDGTVHLFAHPASIAWLIEGR